MKLRSYILIIALAMMALPMSAQSNFEVMEEALASTLHKFSTPADTVANNISKRYRKDAEAQVHIGRAYFLNRNFKRADDYVQRALEINPNYGKAIVLQGDMAAFRGDTIEALNYYKVAMQADTTDMTAYLRYVDLVSTTDPQQALTALDKLRETRHGAEVDANKGYIYYKALDFDKAAESYGKADPEKLDEDNTIYYAASLYFTKRFQESLDVAEQGAQRFNDPARFSRVIFYDQAELGRNEQAKESGERLAEYISQGKIDKPSVRDVRYYALACTNLGQYDEAMHALANAAANDSLFSAIDRKAISDHAMQIVGDIQARGDVDLAVSTYRSYLDTKGDLTPFDEYQLTKIYKAQVDTLLAQNQDATAAYEKLDKVYEHFERTYPNWSDVGVVFYYHAVYANHVLDPYANNGAAEQLFENLINYEDFHNNIDTAWRDFRISAYNYLAYLNAQRGDYKAARDYARKLLAIDPSNQNAKSLLRQMR